MFQKPKQKNHKNKTERQRLPLNRLFRKIIGTKNIPFDMNLHRNSFYFRHGRKPPNYEFQVVFLLF